MYNPQRELNHLGSGLAKLLSQFQNKPNIAGVLQSYLNRIQEWEDAIWEVIYKRNIDNGEGAQLDIIGRIVLRGRGLLNDDNYRIALRCQIRINKSCGTPEDMIDVAQLSQVGPFTFDEYYPATEIIDLTDPVDFDLDVLWSNLHQAKAGGVRLQLIYSLDDMSNRFTLDDAGATLGLPPSRGFADAGTFPYDGGLLTSVRDASS